MSGESKTVVLIHGLWMTPTNWNPFREFYERRSYRVLAPAWEEVAEFVLSWAVPQNGAANFREQPPETGNFTHLRHALTNHDS